jgi:hypothetical protein
MKYPFAQLLFPAAVETIKIAGRAISFAKVHFFRLGVWPISQSSFYCYSQGCQILVNFSNPKIRADPPDTPKAQHKETYI